MKRCSVALHPVASVLLVAAFTARLGAQDWNDPRSRALVEQATERRARQIADTALVDYRADAHGYLTFLAQLGEGFVEPPKIVKADELALEVYWRAPNLSKQIIVGRRDTLLLPTDITYHRDHLGIVQNNFPNIIRLGDGDEVRDVPHPLSADGLTEYDFAIRDSLQIRLGPRTLDVYEVRVRPRDERQPRAVGAVYIDRESGEVVRMAFSFTRSALRDKDLEDVSVVLENGLIEGFWLPRRQEIEIRRTGTWLDYPARGIIRGRWEICCYQVNEGVPPSIFTGPEIVRAPAGTPQRIPFSGRVLDSLPGDVRAVTDAEVARVQEEARALVRAEALARARNTSLAARRVSDVIAVNRVEGLALGTGVTRRLGEGFAATIRGRYGSADDRLKGRAELTYGRASGAGFTLSGYDEHREAGDETERSRVINSLAAQEFGSDYTDPFGIRGVSGFLRSATFAPWSVWIQGAIERHRALSVNATPATGGFEPTIGAWKGDERRLTLGLDRPTRLAFAEFEVRFGLRASAISFAPQAEDDRLLLGRFSAQANFERPVGTSRLLLRSLLVATAGPDVPPQHLAYLGGPVTAPGYDFHELAARAGASQRFELQFPVPFPSVRLGRYGRSPAAIRLAPYAGVAWVGRRVDARSLRGPDAELDQPLLPNRQQPAGWYPSVGLGALLLFDLVRVDVARGLRNGRWSFSIDVARDFWSIL